MIQRRLQTSSSRNSPNRRATGRSRNELRQKKNSRLRLPKILSPAASCSHLLITRSLSLIIINGGATSKARTGGTRSGRKAISKARKIILCCRSLILTRKHMRNGRENVCQLKRSLNSPRAAGYPERHTFGAMNFVPVGNGWPTRGRESFQ